MTTSPGVQPGRPGPAEIHRRAASSEMSVTDVAAEQILDSRGWPTVSVSLTVEDGAVVGAAAPAGASTGAFEAVELRDGGPGYSGRGVSMAVARIEGEIAATLKARPWPNLAEVDQALRKLDGTPNLSRLGANAVSAVSMAAARGFAHIAGLPLYRWIARETGSVSRLPVPHFNVLNGGAHAANDLDFQEFMIAPVGMASERLGVQAGSEIYHVLQAKIAARYGTAGLGDEGGFALPISSPIEALDLLVEAIGGAGYSTDQVKIAIDPAANGFYRGDGVYRVNGDDLSREQLAGYYERLLADYPLWSIEDGLAEDDHAGWQLLLERVGDRAQIVGDDLYVTDAARISDGAERRYSNAALIKVNQIGTVSQTFEAIAVAREAGMACMVSHRSGETSDDFIADLAVGTGVGQIKSGAPARGERVAKYNRLTHIEALQPSLRYGLA